MSRTRRSPFPTASGPQSPSLCASRSQKLGEGLWLLAGGSAQQRGCRVQRSCRRHRGAAQRGTIDRGHAEVNKLIPNKPIRYVVNTHHHWDHLGGIRTYVHEGATVVTHEGNRPYYQEVLRARPWVLQPDRFSLHPPEEWSEGYIFETMREKYVLDDDYENVELHNIQGLAHAAGHADCLHPAGEDRRTGRPLQSQATALNASNRTFYRTCSA